MPGKQALEARGILLLYNGAYPGPRVIAESVTAFRRFSRFPVFPVDAYFGYPDGLDSVRFDVIALHYTMFYAGFGPLSRRYREYLTLSRETYKVAFFQDEQAYLAERLAFCAEYAIDCVYTCMEPPYAEQVYLPTGASRVINYLPGYVSDRLRARARRLVRPDDRRRIDIGYRGRRPPASWGGAALEKYEIAVEFNRRAKGLGLKLDIETEERKRIYGRPWERFVARCKGMLGTESGAVLPGVGASLDAIPYRTISPRHFEAAAFRTCQILYEGEYSGILRPMVHYIPLRKDFSNFDEVIARFRRLDLRHELTENAYRDLISSERYSYRAFIRAFDAGLSAAGVEPVGGARGISVNRALYPPRTRGRRYWKRLRTRARLARDRIWRRGDQERHPLAESQRHLGA